MRNKELDKIRNIKYRLSNWGKILILAAKRNRKNSQNKKILIDEDWVYTKFKEQKVGVIGLMLNYVYLMFPSILKPSLDRFDSKKDYTPDNTVISALSINLGRNEIQKGLGGIFGKSKKSIILFST